MTRHTAALDVIVDLTATTGTLPPGNVYRVADTWSDWVAAQVTEQLVDRWADRVGGVVVLPHNSHLAVGGRHRVAPLGDETERQVGPLECTSAREADSGTHDVGDAGRILKKSRTDCRLGGRPFAVTMTEPDRPVRECRR